MAASHQHSRLAVCAVIGVVVVLTAAAPARPTVTIINTSARQQVLQAWGTSLCWWANGIGRWMPNSTQYERVMDLVFDADKGLGINLVRYNIGGGEDPQYWHFLRPGAYVEGFQVFRKYFSCVFE